MDIDFQISNGIVKLVEQENKKDKLKKKKRTLVIAEENLRKIVASKINGKLGMC